MRRIFRLRNLVWVLIPLLVWWSLRHIDFYQVWNTICSLHLYQILVLIALNSVIVLALTGRWWFALRSFGGRIPLTHMAGYRLSSFSISYFTPGTQFGGEPLQVHFPIERHQVPTSTALAAVTVDKIFDVMTNFSFIAAGLVLFLSYGFSLNELTAGFSFLLLAILTLPMLYMLALWAGWAPFTKLLTGISSLKSTLIDLDKIRGLVNSTEDVVSFRFQQQPLIILWMFLLSVLIWLLLIAEYWLSLTFIGAELNFLQMLLALTAARIAFLMPLPGGIGALEASQIWAMGTLGFDPVLGVSLVLIIRARDIFLGILGLVLTALYINRGSKNNAALQTADPLPSGD
jgi:uncharacterized protein (TIRG00374 family)